MRISVRTYVANEHFLVFPLCCDVSQTFDFLPAQLQYVLLLFTAADLPIHASSHRELYEGLDQSDRLRMNGAANHDGKSGLSAG